MIPVDLTGPRLKLGRAEAHIDALRREIGAFVSSEPQPFGFSVEKEPGAGESVNYVVSAVIREAPRTEWV